MPIEHRDAVRGGVQNGAELAKLGFLAAQLHFEAGAAAGAAMPRWDKHLRLPLPRDPFVPPARRIRFDPAYRPGPRRAERSLGILISDIEHRSGKQRRRSLHADTAAKKCDGSGHPADAKPQIDRAGRGIENEGRGEIGELFRKAAFAAGKQARQAAEVFHAKDIEQAFAGENEALRLRRIFAAHRDNRQRGGKPNRQDRQNIRDILASEARRAAKSSGAALAFLRQHGYYLPRS